MSAHHHRCATGDLLQGGGTHLALELAGQPRHFQAQGFEPALEGDEVLFSEDFGRRHQRHLVTGFQCLQGGEGGNHGLARAHVALDQAQHRFMLAEIVGDFITYPLLGARRRKAKVGQVLGGQARGLGHRRRAQGAHAFAQALLGQLVGQQFFEGQAMLSPVMAQCKFVDVSVGGWVMQVANRIVQRRQLIVARQLQR
ncbi:hypothetical protein [Pseudomonas sp. 22 E 5]|nr:hypothetical protein [Pseudomonas sp. 22 E 5]